MKFRTKFSHTVVCFLALVLVLAQPSAADLREADLKSSIVSVNTYRGKQVVVSGTGAVVQSDRFNGYVLTNASLIEGKDTLTVSVPDSGAELVAQVLLTNSGLDIALLKINGLHLPVLQFAAGEPEPGEVVWSAVRWESAGKSVGLARGNLRNSYSMASSNVDILSHNAIVGEGSLGSILLNDCGEAIGLNMTFKSADANVRAISADSLRRVLGEQNVRVSRAPAACVSAIDQAKAQAQLASAEAQRAKTEAAEAQRVARSMAEQLTRSNAQNLRLIDEATKAKDRAEEALLAAARAQQHAEQTRIELERKTASIVAETEAMVAHLQADKEAAEKRFKQAIAEQKLASEGRETLLLALFVGFIAVLIAIVFIMQRSGVKVPAVLQAVPLAKAEPEAKAAEPAKTDMHRQALAEYVLDGRDEDGIRYLLRISGDQLDNTNGVIIGRNPNDSPYIINHSDVSRQHARLKVMKNRVFIEDLGSTNGTSVNGQNIDEKGLVSVANGDQIIIGSVVMKLRVLNG